MKIKKLFTFLGLYLFIYGIGVAQTEESIKFNTPSFEDNPAFGEPPLAWHICDDIVISSPDTQPLNQLLVSQYASHGGTFIGMITRDVDTWESIGQVLDSPLKGGSCYVFNMDLCKSENYISYSRATRQLEDFNQPVQLRIWGGDVFCDRKELLIETKSIEHLQWESYTFLLEPEEDVSSITFEVYYTNEGVFPYNGNMMLDNLSNIAMLTCDESYPKVSMLHPKTDATIQSELNELDSFKVAMKMDQLPNLSYYKLRKTPAVSMSLIEKEKLSVVKISEKDIDENLNPDELITHFGKYLLFNEYNRLEKHVIILGNEEKIDNVAMWTISKVFEFLPKDQVLVFFVKGGIEGTTSSKRFQIKRYLRKVAKISYRRFEVKDYETPKGNEIKWLVGNKDIAIGIKYL